MSATATGGFAPQAPGRRADPGAPAGDVEPPKKSIKKRC